MTPDRYVPEEHPMPMKRTIAATRLGSVAIVVTCFGVLPGVSVAAEWQWSVPVEGVTSSETNGPPRAFSWIPPSGSRLRAVVVGQHNMEEEPILEHRTFRQALSELGAGSGVGDAGLRPVLPVRQRCGRALQRD